MCDTCGTNFDHDVLACACGGEIVFAYDQPVRENTALRSMWRWHNRLPVGDSKVPVSLGEGATPLLSADGLVEGIRLYLKDETRNPSGSMKDRAMSVAFTKAREFGSQRSIILSAGGSGIAASVYAARANMTNLVVVPSDVPPLRLLLSHLAGSILVRVDGNVEDALAVVERARRSGAFYEVSTYRKGNPYQAEAQKTIAYEVVEDLGRAPDTMVIPIGGGGTLAGIQQGFQDLLEAGRIERVPRLIGVQNRKFNALQLALEQNLESLEDVLRVAETIDSSAPTETGGLRHAYPPDGVAALRAVRAVGGDVASVTDDEAVDWQVRLSHAVGILAEPSSTASLAAVAQLAATGRLAVGETVVALITGAGWRDLGRIADRTRLDIHSLEAGADDAVERLLALSERG